MSEHDSEANPFLGGKLLIAMPAIGDTRFAQTVIYICAHTVEGAMGIVVNRPLAAPTLETLFSQLDVTPNPPLRRLRLCAGGPVDKQRGFVLHTTDWTSEASLQVDDGLALTASLDVLKVVAGGGGPRECVLALGYAGWGPGQLDAELSNNVWLSSTADETLVFDDENETKWVRALARLHIDPLQLSSTAGHA